MIIPYKVVNKRVITIDGIITGPLPADYHRWHNHRVESIVVVERIVVVESKVVVVLLKV